MKHLVLRIGSGLGSRRTIAASAAVAAALLVSSVVAAAPAAKVPKRWHGTALYTYTYTGDDGSVQQTMNASVVLVPVRVRGWTNTYQVSTGTIKWDYKQQTSDGCTLTSSGSYRATKYHLVLQLQLQRGRRPRAFFSGQEGGASDYPTATITCPDGTSETTTLGSGIGNPFFMLTRKTAGVPVKAALTKIAGSLRTAESGAVWTLRFSFVGKR
jgi:hypothetical protein